ncbi:hypothetical protein [Ferrovibrio sp.]|uniref:sulfotransferase family protein n=1 Tax=Ferrovibrio sp. TaxID=1917215 RepID=UPI003D136F6D
MKRHIVLIAGMHRSGTSALTRLINLLGAGLAPDLLPARSDNVKGFWEGRRIVDIHDSFLTAVGSGWDDFTPLPEDAFSSSAAATARRALGEALAEFDGQALAVVKDPRLCRLLPLWHEPLAEHGFEPLVALILRQPMEVAGSLKSRNHFPVEKGLLLWLTYILEAEFHSRGMKRVFTSYDLVLAEWRAVAVAMARAWKLQWPVDLDAASDEITTFLDADLRHQQATEVSGPLPLRQMVDEVTALFEGSIAAKTKSTKHFDRVRVDLQRAASVFAPVLSSQRETIFELGRSVAAHAKETDRLANLFDLSQTHVRNIEADVVKLTGALNAKEAERELAVQLSAQHAAELDQAKQFLGVCQQGRSDLELRVAEGEAKLTEAEAAREVLRATVAELGARIEVAQLALNHAEARIVTAERRVSTQEMELKRSAQSLAAEQHAHRTLAEAHAALQQSWQEQVLRLDAQAAEIQVLRDHLAQSQAEAISRAEQIEHLSIHAAALEQRCEGLAKDLAELNQRHAALEEKHQALESLRDKLIQERDGLIQERHVLTAERDSLISERGKLVQERDGLEQTRRQLDHELAELNQTYQTLQRDHERAEHANARLIEQFDHLSADLTASHDKCLLLEDTLQRIQQSRSWRMTAPLRKIGAALRE